MNAGTSDAGLSPAGPAPRRWVLRLSTAGLAEGLAAWFRGWRLAVWLAAGGLGLALFAGTGYDYEPLRPAAGAAPAAAASDEEVPIERRLAEARRAQRRLVGELGRLAPRGTYIAIDRTNNRLYLRRGEETLLEAVCSAGSGSILRDREGQRTWTFDTPTGAFHVRGKRENPVWRKPDWAFVEEGQEVPSDAGERMEYDMLGDYALDLGDGYLIHGTLYERLLGRSVTHGCIRLGRDDLREVYEATPIGTPVFIY